MIRVDYLCPLCGDLVFSMHDSIYESSSFICQRCGEYKAPRRWWPHEHMKIRYPWKPRMADEIAKAVYWDTAPYQSAINGVTEARKDIARMLWDASRSEEYKGCSPMVALDSMALKIEKLK